MNEIGSIHDVTRGDVEEFYGSYYDTLDEVRLADWPLHFAEDCLYRIVSRENHEGGMRLSTIICESRGMLFDRVTGLTQTQVYAPRYYRRFQGPFRVRPVEGAILPVEHNVLVVQTLIDKQSEIVMAARCLDKLVVEEDKLLFKQRVIVFDSEMVPNSLIYPV